VKGRPGRTVPHFEADGWQGRRRLRHCLTASLGPVVRPRRSVGACRVIGTD
jgi:hypothetical protein